jgi:hypothetical protein
MKNKITNLKIIKIIKYKLLNKNRVKVNRKYFWIIKIINYN